MNFLYVYTGYQLHQLPDNDNKGFWIFNIMAQFILPKDIKLVANYGTFPVINATQEGVKPVGSLNPYQRVEAETMAFSEGVKTEPNDRTGIYVSDIHNGDYIKVREVDLGKKGASKLEVSVASALRGGIIEVYADSIGGTLITEIQVPHTGGWEAWKTLETAVKQGEQAVSGTHDLYFCFKGRKGCKLFNFDWWKLVE
jgi:hypothetical protein